MNLPRKLNRTPKASEFNRLIDYCRSLLPAQGPNVLTQHTPFGIIRKANPSGISIVQPASSTDCRMFMISTVGGGSLWDYFKAKEITPPSGTLSGLETLIAKQQEYRPSMTTEYWDTTQTDYSWTDDNNRTSTIHGSSPTVSQTEIMWPPFQAGTHKRTIVAIKVPYTGVTVDDVPLVWLDITPRVWQRIYGQ